MVAFLCLYPLLPLFSRVGLAQVEVAGDLRRFCYPLSTGIRKAERAVKGKVNLDFCFQLGEDIKSTSFTAPFICSTVIGAIVKDFLTNQFDKTILFSSRCIIPRYCKKIKSDLA